MLLALPAELLCHICAMLDVQDVKHVTSTCRRLSQLGGYRTLWLDLIDELAFYETPDFPPHYPLSTYSTEGLRKRANDAFRIADLSRGKTNLRFCKLTRIRISEREQKSEQSFRKVDPLLLPGRRRLLVNNQGCLELWAVGLHDAQHHCLWKTDPTTDSLEAIAFHGEVAEHGTAIKIAGVSTKKGDRPRLRVYNFHEIDQKSSLVFEAELPPNVHASYSLKIHKHYVLLYRPLSFEVWICDLTSGKIRSMSFGDQNNESFRIKSALLIEDFLIVTGDVGDLLQDTTLQIFSVRVSSILTSTSDSNNEGDRITVRIERSQELPGAKGKWGLAVNAYRPTWKRRANPPIEVLVVALSQERTMAMHSFRLQLDVPVDGDKGTSVVSTLSIGSKPSDSGSGFLQLHLKQSTRAKCTDYPLSVAGALSNSGLFFTLSPKFKCFAAFCEDDQPSLMHAKTSEYLMASLAPTNTYATLVSMEPWSGSICVGSEGMVSILRLD